MRLLHSFSAVFLRVNKVLHSSFHYWSFLALCFSAKHLHPCPGRNQWPQMMTVLVVLLFCFTSFKQIKASAPTVLCFDDVVLSCSVLGCERSLPVPPRVRPGWTSMWLTRFQKIEKDHLQRWRCNSVCKFVKIGIKIVAQWGPSSFWHILKVMQWL